MKRATFVFIAIAIIPKKFDISFLKNNALPYEIQLTERNKKRWWPILHMSFIRNDFVFISQAVYETRNVSFQFNVLIE